MINVISLIVSSSTLGVKCSYNSAVRTSDLALPTYTESIRCAATQPKCVVTRPHFGAQRSRKHVPKIRVPCRVVSFVIYITLLWRLLYF